jgi:tight adherence protein C
MLQESLLITSVFGSVGAVVWTLAQRILDGDNKRISDRLNNRQRNDDKSKSADGKGRNAQSPLKRFGTWAARPFMGESGAATTDKLSGLRARLAMAGIYDPAAIRSVVGFKFIMMSAGVLFGYVGAGMAGHAVMGAAFGGLLGYLAPQVWLKSKIGANQLALNHGLPDALDLMVICVESGLTVDGTLQRVGDELAMAHPAISREFGICHTETRLGVTRQQSFKNLATRTGNVNLQSLTAMLIQADRFGTSVATALRVQAEAMRTKRQFAAEEMAGKASVKMSFPLVLFIFPATFLVMMGPMIVQFMTSSSL